MTKTINKTQLAKQLSKLDYLDLPHSKAIRIIDELITLISQHFYEGGDKIVLRGFGTFRRSRLPGRKGYNVSRRKTEIYPSKSVIRFKTGQSFLRLINQ